MSEKISQFSSTMKVVWLWISCHIPSGMSWRPTLAQMNTTWSFCAMGAKKFRIDGKKKKLIKLLGQLFDMSSGRARAIYVFISFCYAELQLLVVAPISPRQINYQFQGRRESERETINVLLNDRWWMCVAFSPPR